jgi:hypothetical protein
MMDRAVEWIVSQKTSTPFFLHFLTNSPHHPFDVPENYTGSYQSSQDDNRYKKALNYVDAAIGQLLEALEANGLFEDTMIVITGDHGEPLAGDSHSHARGRNYLYQNAVKSFMLIKPPGDIKFGIRTSNTGTHGDILPSLLQLNGIDNFETPGQSMLSDEYRQRIIYFNSSNQPGEWGLLDGNWKYLATGDSGKAELYDLAKDPEELQNLAADNPNQITTYQKLCANWFMRKNEDFLNRLQGASGIGVEQPLEIAETGGIYSLVAGYLSEQQSELIYQPQTSLHPSSTVVISTQWLPSKEKKMLHYEWTSPSGIVFKLPVPVVRRSVAPMIALDAPSPLETGTWKMRVVDESNKQLAFFAFEVSDTAPVGPRAEDLKLLRGMRAVVIENQAIRPIMNATKNEQIGLQLRWQPVHLRRDYAIRIILPDGRFYRRQLPARQVGQVNQIIPLNVEADAPRGKWTVNIYSGSRALASTQFVLD